MQIHRSLEYSAAALGVAGQVWDCVAAPDLLTGRYLHGLFGLFLCASIVGHHWQRSAGAASARDWDGLVRSVSRRIYILLYALAGVRALLDATVGTEPHSDVPADYFGYGLLALLTVRLLAAVGRAERLPSRLEGTKGLEGAKGIALKVRLP